ncbi:MAG: uncharacterized protein QOE90_2755 [Thermoplasmata archaeon]|jgi:small GTP-binding protein|nr:uncharacterized protein [Thermoplasmata archaeon]
MSSVEAVGVPQLERLICPMPEHSSVLFVNDPGVEAEAFLYQGAYAHLSAGRRVVYAVTNRAPESVLAAMSALGLDVFSHKEQLIFVDAFAAHMAQPSSAQHVVQQPSNPLDFARTLEAAAREAPDAMLVVDGLSTLVDQAGPEKFEAAWPRIQGAMARFRWSESLFTKWPYGEGVMRLLDDFDAVVTLKGVEDRITISQYFRVERARWRPDVDTKPRLYRALKPGGVHVFIPKIVITGPYNAGKSSFVHAVSDTAVSVDELGTTVALDHGRVTMEGLTADIFGTPGQSRFDPILRVVAGQALGVVVVVDSTKPESFARAAEMMALTWKQGLPGVVAANKQDLPGALSPEEIAKTMTIPKGIRVVPCSGQDRESARRVLRELIDLILAHVVSA